MSKPRHTPGPWNFIRDRDCIARPDGVGIALMARSTLVGQMPPGHVMVPTIAKNTANGWLIAAAPDLLDACELLLHQVEAEYGIDPDDTVDPGDCRAGDHLEAIALARAAIAKATAAT